jgi:hypothetical protein
MSVEYDEQGRPFVWANGKKNFISPAAFGEAPPDDDTGIFHERPQWDQNKGEWETPFDWGNLVTMGTGAALGGGVASALGAFGGGAAGAGGSAGLSSLPTTALPALPAASMGGGAAAGAGAAAGGAAAGSGGLMSNLPTWVKALISGGAGVGVRALSGGLGGFGGGQQMPEEWQQLMAEAMRRMAAQRPLSEAVNKQAFEGLPAYAKGGK